MTLSRGDACALPAAAPVLRDLHLASRTCFQEWAARWSNEFELVRQGLP
jgi:hypothetical protein